MFINDAGSRSFRAYRQQWIAKINTPLTLKEGNVKVIIMYAENEEMAEERLWMQSISNNPAFDFLKDPQENIYSLNDGKPPRD